MLGPGLESGPTLSKDDYTFSSDTTLIKDYNSSSNSTVFSIYANKSEINIKWRIDLVRLLALQYLPRCLGAALTALSKYTIIKPDMKSCVGIKKLRVTTPSQMHKYTAEVAGVPLFNAQQADMNSFSRYPLAQALALTNAHDKTREALPKLIDTITLPVGHVFRPSATPFKDKGPTPHDQKVLELPESLSITLLSTHELVESALSPILEPLDNDPTAHTYVSIDAEWNISRLEGVSIIQIAPHSSPNQIFIIPVYQFNNSLPPSLLRLFTSTQISKVGVNLKGDLTRLRKQFPELSATVSTTTADSIIDLRDYCFIRRVIPDRRAGSLKILCHVALDLYLSKSEALRMHNKWETRNLAPELVNYAALDVYASRMVFEKVSERLPIERPSVDSPPGTRVALQLCSNGDPIAYGRIAQESRPAKLGSVRVRTPSNNRIVLDIDVIIDPSATVDLHKHPSSKNLGTGLRPALTLGELHDSAPNGLPFQIVTPISLVDFDQRDIPSED